MTLMYIYQTKNGENERERATVRNFKLASMEKERIYSGSLEEGGHLDGKR